MRLADESKLVADLLPIAWSTMINQQPSCLLLFLTSMILWKVLFDVERPVQFQALSLL
jgi:hypothetical protein